VYLFSFPHLTVINQLSVFGLIGLTLTLSPHLLHFSYYVALCSRVHETSSLSFPHWSVPAFICHPSRVVLSSHSEFMRSLVCFFRWKSRLNRVRPWRLISPPPLSFPSSFLNSFNFLHHLLEKTSVGNFCGLGAQHCPFGVPSPPPILSHCRSSYFFPKPPPTKTLENPAPPQTSLVKYCLPLLFRRPFFVPPLSLRATTRFHPRSSRRAPYVWE